ncbi:hypothetical protein CFOL_v3_15392 [Cephalotus follicularis]|uniref:Hepatoma-derived growth factor-related protein 2-like n=1 Tax=Cephalotus follicularis TaxID=3775 RepID=A0A1Q3BV95_CEPFO|nr:hypothetical protein CFOL_v3_15390 [Cephalotus follicularis]GAV71903.1 hypothetical protein CFOL_v3_15392 [Cephalotus follicularis]
MADFGFLSDTDDSAVEELIAQVQELSVLEQVSAINCSGFTHSALPPELESRFHKLKSFPLSKPTIDTTKSKSLRHSKSEFSHSVNPKTEKNEPDKEFSGHSRNNPNTKSGLEREKGLKNESDSISDEGSEILSVSKRNPEGKFGSREKSKYGYVSSPSSSSNSSKENRIFSASKQNPQETVKLTSELKSGSLSSPCSSSNSWLNSPSPPTKSGCFWCSPKKVSKKKKDKELDTGFNWSKHDEFLSDLSTFSVKEQEKKLKKAMKEQQKMSSEAEKIVKWAKQASARMSFHGIEDELSDADSAKRV